MQIFTLNILDTNTTETKNTLNLSEQIIYANLQKMLTKPSENFLFDTFLPLKNQTDLFLHHLCRENTDLFLLKSDETLLLQNF